MSLGEVKIVYASTVLGLVLLGSYVVDSNPRLSRILRMLGFIAIPALMVLTGYLHLHDYQLVLLLIASIIAVGVSLHSEGYYKVLYGVSRRFQLVVDVILASLILLFSSSYFIELIIYWFFLDLFVAFAAITMEHGAENLPVASTYIVMCIAPSDLALLTMWALLALKYGVINSMLIDITSSTLERIQLDPVISSLLLFGFAVKMGQFPLHSWLPVVHGKSPSHVSAILSGIIVKMGAYAYFLTTQLFNVQDIASYILAIQGLVSAIYGSFGAVMQTNIKYLLAYSTISYCGIITLLFAAHVMLKLDVLRLVLLLVIVFHSLTKSLMFINTGFIYQVANTYDIYRLGYLYYVDRRVASAVFTALMNLTGIPPSIGFLVKVLIVALSIALTLTHPIGMLLLIAIVVSSVFSIAYGAKFMSTYISTLPRIHPKIVLVPLIEAFAELYLAVVSLIAPIPVFITLLALKAFSIDFIITLVLIYSATIIAYIVFMRWAYARSYGVEVGDVKYWLSGVEA